MRRLAQALAAVLALAAASPARSEPLDIDLTRIGAPDPQVWSSIFALSGSGTAGTEATLAKEAKQRFAVLSTELALALSSAILQPASTTGHSGFAVDLEIATASVEGGTLGGTTPDGFTNRTWATRATDPSMLYLPSVHVRKGLPWSFEVGGRMIYLAQSSYYAAQGEAKWALNEGFAYLPDFAVRAAYTRMFGNADWNLGTTDLDVMLSKRWGLRGVISLTPYLVGRFTHVSASSERMDFFPARATATPDPVDLGNTQASFPHFSTSLYRGTLGLRFTTYAISLALEGTYFAGASPSSSGYEDVKVASSFGGAAKLGWEF